MARVHDDHISAFASFGSVPSAGGAPGELIDVSLPDATHFTLAETAPIQMKAAEPEPCLIGIERPDGTIRTLGILDPAASTYDPETRTGTISIAPDPTDAINRLLGKFADLSAGVDHVHVDEFSHLYENTVDGNEINGVPLSQWRADQHTQEKPMAATDPKTREAGDPPTYMYAITAAADALDAATRKGFSPEHTAAKVSLAKTYMELATLIRGR